MLWHAAACNQLTASQPLLHTVVLLIQFAMVARLVAKFNSYYAQKPLLTTMITNAVSETCRLQRDAVLTEGRSLVE